MALKTRLTQETIKPHFFKFKIYEPIPFIRYYKVSTEQGYLDLQDKASNKLFVRKGDYIVSEEKSFFYSWVVNAEVFEKTYALKSNFECVKKGTVYATPLNRIADGQVEVLTSEGLVTVEAYENYLLIGKEQEVWPIENSRFYQTYKLLE